MNETQIAASTAPTGTAVAAGTAAAAATDVDVVAVGDMTDVSAITTSSATGDDGDVAIVSTPREKKGPADPLKDAKIDSIEVSVEAVNHVLMISKKNALPDDNREMTRLVSINGVAISELTVPCLKTFCKANGIFGTRKMKKALICDMILTGKAAFEREGAGVSVDIKEEKKERLSRVRYVNVLFSEGIRPLIANRGKSLNKDELTEGLKTDQVLHEKIAEEYNDKNNKSHGKVAFPSLGDFENCHPSTFSRITWQQSIAVFKKIVKEYEYAFNNWKLSGTHEEMIDNVTTMIEAPFSNFAKAGTVLYFHEYVSQYPGFLDKATGALPGDAFSESIATTNPTTPKSGKRTRRPKNDRSSSSSKDSSSTDLSAFVKDQSQRTKFIHTSLLNATASALEKDLDHKKDRKRRLMKELTDECNGKKQGKERLKKFVRHKSLHRGTEVDSDDGSLDSQASLMQDIIDQEESIESMRQLKKTAKEQKQNNNKK